MRSLSRFKQDRQRWIQWLFEAKRRFGLVVLNYLATSKPRRKNIIIACERLRELAGFQDYESFASAHRQWVQATLEDIDAKRASRWTESIAVGSSPFIERIKNAMGAMAKGRAIQSAEGAFELREAQSTFIRFLRPKIAI
jgi:putative transposase